MLFYLATLFLVSEKKRLFQTEGKKKKKEHIEFTRFFLPCSRAMSQVALSPLSCLQRQQLPLILDNVTAMDHVHLQLHIPIHIPARQSKTCQRNDNNNKNNDLYGYYQQV